MNPFTVFSSFEMRNRNSNGGSSLISVGPVKLHSKHVTTPWKLNPFLEEVRLFRTLCGHSSPQISQNIQISSISA